MAAVKGLNFKVSATAAGLSALSSFTKALGGIRSAGDVAKNSMLGFSSEMNKQARGYDALKALSTSYAAALGQIDRAYRLNAVSGDEWAAATERVERQFAQAQALFAESPADASSFLGKFTAELEALTAKYNPAVAASQRYDTAVVELNHALHLGAIDANQYAQNIQKIPGSLAQVIAQNERLTLSMKSAADAASVFDTEFNRLQDKFNPAAAEVRRLEAALSELSRAEKMGVISAEAYESQMLAMKAQIASLNTGINSLETGNRRWNRGLSDTNRALQQAGFQVNDFFIQVAGGQNIVLALTQQLGQLVQFFGVWGSLAGAALAVGGSLFLMFGDLKTAVEELNDANDALKGSLSSLSSNGGMSLEDLKKKYGEVDTELMSLLRHQKEYDLLMADRSAVTALNAVYGEFDDRLRTIGAQSRAGTLAMSSLRDQLGFTAQGVQDFNRAFNDAMKADTLREKAEAFARLDGFLANSKLAGTELANQVREVALALREVDAAAESSAGSTTRAAVGLAGQLRNIGAWALQANNQVAGFEPAIARSIGATQGLAGWAQMANANIKGSADEAQRLANTNMVAGIAAAAGWAQSLWVRLSGAAAAARAMASLSDKRLRDLNAGAMGRAGAPGQGIARDYSLDAWNKLLLDVTGAGTGGGGGGGTSPIEQLRQDYAKLMDDMSPLIASTRQFRDVNEAAMAAFDAGNVEAVKSALAEATEIASEFKSVADSISSAFMSAFSGIIKGTKSVHDGVMDMLESVFDRTLDMLMSPVFDGVAKFLTSSIFGFVGAMPALPSFAGGGGTGNAPRSGGIDGKGGFLAVMHPKESVTDHTIGGGASGGVVVNVYVDGATGNNEIMEMVNRGVSKGLEYYDAKILPGSMKRVAANPRRT